LTDFDANGQTIIMLSLLTRHGRATPLMWLTVETATLKSHRNEYEYQALVRLADALPLDTKVCIVADRGVGDQKVYRFRTEDLKFDYVICSRGNITVTGGGRRGAHRRWVGWTRRTRRPAARRPRDRGALSGWHRCVCVRDEDMKQTWCLATNLTNATASVLKELYGKRCGIECGFRDTKDLHFDMGI
jgi:hypothetical protein